jgi:parallel beta-helix repeat protein
MKTHPFQLIIACFVFLAINASATVLYVDLNSSNPTPPYADWSTAATSIQDAIDVSTDGDQILVTNGVYQTGGCVIYGSLTNRVAVTRAVTVQSVNGPEVTVIQGEPLTPENGASARCVYLTNNATLSGFTLTNGAASNMGDWDFEDSGGGVWCEDSSAVVTNCIITGNSAYADGGGACGGTLIGCTLTGNSASSSGGGTVSAILNHCTLSANTAYYGGGADYSTLSDCVLSNNTATAGFPSAPVFSRASPQQAAPASGGGAAWSTLTRCNLTENQADGEGGGAYAGALDQCMLTGNTADNSGGGANSCTLSNCVLTGNSAVYNGGGAAYCEWLANCTLTGNTADNSGGGAYVSTLDNCALTGNSADSGGGTCYSTLNNCTLTDNSAANGGGIYNSTLNNCIIYFNSAPYGANYFYQYVTRLNDSPNTYGNVNYCCTTPLPDSGTGNISADPQLTDTMHLGSGSPCRGAGSADYVTGVDIDGEAWASPPAIGCDEYSPGATGQLSVFIRSDYTNVATGFPIHFTAMITGHASSNHWDFGDGTGADNQSFSAAHSWVAAGDYPVVLTAYNDSNPGGVSATLLVHVAEDNHYVDLTSTNPVAPYTSWDTAATNIQDAVDAAVLPGAHVIVTNGVYASGGRAVDAQTNRVVISKFVYVQSVNGPETTVIQGYQEPDTINGYDTVRCVYLADGASLAGFTLTQGATLPDGSWWIPDDERNGGGVWCESGNSVVSNCVFTGNSAVSAGGGVSGGTLINCTLTNNTASYGGGANNCTLNNSTLTGNSAGFNGGGAISCTLNGCTLANNSAYYGGGADSSTLQSCVLSGNTAALNGGGANSSILNLCTMAGNFGSFGGGASDSTLTSCTLSNNFAVLFDYEGGQGGGADYCNLANCVLMGNSADYIGGGVDSSTLNNCTLAGNSAGSSGGGASDSALNNCIIYFNTAPDGPNFAPPTEYYYGCILNYCCTIPLPDNGVGNITNEPSLLDPEGGDFHLLKNSPCINSGNNSFVTLTNDFDGNPRIMGGTVDIGAYEFQWPMSVISYAWLQQYDLSTSGSDDYADADGDGMNNWQEWIAGTDPTDPSSLLKITTATSDVSGMTITWQSVNGMTYFLQRSTDLGAQPAFTTIQTGIAGQPDTTSYTDTDATGAGPYFYRVGVQQ